MFLLRIRLTEEDPQEAEALALRVCGEEEKLFSSDQNPIPPKWYEFLLFGGNTYKETAEKVERLIKKALSEENIKDISRHLLEIEIEDPATGHTVECKNVWAMARALRRTGELEKVEIPATVEVHHAGA